MRRRPEKEFLEEIKKPHQQLFSPQLRDGQNAVPEREERSDICWMTKDPATCGVNNFSLTWPPKKVI